MDSKGLLLASGGIDSITAMYELCDDIHAVLFINYGQAVYKNEYNFLSLHTKKLKKMFIVENMVDLYKDLDSPIMDGFYRPNANYEVPNRNITFINYAVSKALSLKLSKVYTGIFETRYADTRTGIYNKLNEIITEISGGKVVVDNVFSSLSKSDIIELGIKKHGIDLGRDTFSCYLNGHNKKHCGICSACIMRQEGFKESKIEDTTEYLTDRS